MLDFNKILVDGLLICLAFSGIVLYMARFKPRLFLSKDDVPADILAAVPPKTDAEKKEAVWFAIPLLVIMIGGTLYSTYTFAVSDNAAWPVIYLHALAIVVFVSVFDLVFIDWLLLNTITPSWVIFPGTEGFAGYKNYAFHLKAHLRAVPILLLGAALSTVIVLLVP